MEFRAVVFRSAATVVVAAAVAASAAAQEGGAEPDVAVLARVNGQAIYQRDVDRLVHESLDGREAPESERSRLAAQALEQLISRKLILARLGREGAAPADDEVQRAIGVLEAQAERNKQTFAEWLKANRFTPQSLREEVAWRIAWRRYLEKHVTDAAMESHFLRHRRDFDGTQLRVSHILWRVTGDDASALRNARAQAEQVRSEIVSGRISFAQAAEKHSQAPSRTAGGDIGYIPRRGLMEEAFSQAAFALEQGEVSRPVQTSFGVHLIQCTGIRPGAREWTDCREELRLAVSRELFDRLAREERAAAKVEFSSANGNDSGRQLR